MEIFQGIVIGVFSGLTLGGLAYIRDRFVRCDQIQYIRELIIKERERIYSIQDIAKPADVGGILSKHEIRIMFYRTLRRSLRSAIEGRASQLSFDEKTGLTDPCWEIDWLTETHNKLPPFQLYTKMFSE